MTMFEDAIKPCVGCEKTSDELYCSDRCMREDHGRVLESPETGKLYYAAEFEKTDEGTFVVDDKRPIDWDGEVSTDD